MSSFFTADFVALVIRVGTPLMFCSMSAYVAALAGIPNIAVEGIMLFGALFGVYFSALFSSAWLGLLGVIGVGVVLALVLAFFYDEDEGRPDHDRYRAEPVCDGFQRMASACMDRIKGNDSEPSVQGASDGRYSVYQGYPGARHDSFRTLFPDLWCALSLRYCLRSSYIARRSVFICRPVGWMHMRQIPSVSR